jgi:ATPase subunit of ABC transporter with duplicated ATPase domains
MQRILLGLGFKHEVFLIIRANVLWRMEMRIELAKLLLQSNDVCTLDEPTNHLDSREVSFG